MEGDVALLESRFVTVTPGQCLYADIYLLLSTDSTEAALTLGIRHEELPYAVPVTLHELREWDHDGWSRLTLPLISGTYRFSFRLVMGFAFQSSAAIDNVLIDQCKDEKTHVKPIYGECIMVLWMGSNFMKSYHVYDMVIKSRQSIFTPQPVLSSRFGLAVWRSAAKLAEPISL